ncbi:MAG: cytidylate kinase family protein [Lachnospiraceae bacterium]|nr:cytidylate kinase family protein [Lachnospiraceae bacterium]
MHITLTGNLGSGKSTLGKVLEADYGYEIYSTGKVIRQIAQEHGVSVLEMNKMMEKDPKYDHMIDDTTARISKEQKEKKLLFDSRLAWNFVEDSFKVFLSVSLSVAAARVMADASRGAVEAYSSLEECKESLKERAATEDRRYKELYGIEYFNYANYNLVLDSSECSPEVLAEILVKEAAACEEKKAKGEKVGTKLILDKNRPAEDFAKERAQGKESIQTICGVEFSVIEL